MWWHTGGTLAALPVDERVSRGARSTINASAGGCVEDLASRADTDRGRCPAGELTSTAVAAGGSVALWSACGPLAKRADRACRNRSGLVRISSAMPTGLEHSDALIRPNHLTIVAHRSCPDRNEGPDIVIE